MQVTSILLSYFLATRVIATYTVRCELLENEKEATRGCSTEHQVTEGMFNLTGISSDLLAGLGLGGIVLWPLIYDFVLETGPSRKMRQARPCWSVDKEVGIFMGIEVKWVCGCIAC